MKYVGKIIVLVSITLVFCLLAATSCYTQNPPVNATTGATTITPKK